MEDVANLEAEEEQAKAHAESYFNPRHKKLLQFQNQKIFRYVESESKVLDAGCGVGSFLIGLEKDIDYIGIDASKNALDTASEKFPGKTFERSDLHNLDFEKDQFDCIILKGVIHHLREPSQVFKELDRVLKPSGRIIIFEGAPESLFRSFVQSVADIVKPDHEVSEFDHKDKTQIRKLLEDQNFEEKNYEKVGGFNVPLTFLGIPQIFKIDSILNKVTYWHNLQVFKNP